MSTAEPTAGHCQIGDAELLAYRDGELPVARRALLAVHVGACPACRRRLADARWIDRTLRDATPLRDHPVARAAIHDRLAADSARRWRRSALVAVALPLVVLVAVVAGQRLVGESDRCVGCPSPAEPVERITASAWSGPWWTAGAACARSPGGAPTGPFAGPWMVTGAPAPWSGLERPAAPGCPAPESWHPNSRSPNLPLGVHPGYMAPGCAANLGQPPTYPGYGVTTGHVGNAWSDARPPNLPARPWRCIPRPVS